MFGQRVEFRAFGVDLASFQFDKLGCVVRILQGLGHRCLLREARTQVRRRSALRLARDRIRRYARNVRLTVAFGNSSLWMNFAEIVTADGPRPVASGTRDLVPHATAALGPRRPGYIVIPGASGPTDGDPDDRIGTIPVRLARFGETAPSRSCAGRSRT
jgi:hypothetical protein